MKIAVTGASGLIGSALVPSLQSSGHRVVRLVRRAPQGPDEVRWDPKGGTVDLAGLQGTEAVIHLAGAGIGERRWSDSVKREILESRVEGTRTIARAMAALDPKPRVLVSGSAIGYYGETGDKAVDEASPPGTGFLAEVVQAWEAATDPAAQAGIRVALARSGIVVSAKGGAFGRLLPLFRLGVGGRMGSGKQYWSWISLRDEVAALTALMEREDLAGPVNLTAPNPATNAEITAALGRVLGRPTLLPVPAFALKTVLGELSTEVLGSARVLPKVLEQYGFTWSDPTIEAALRSVLGRAA